MNICSNIGMHQFYESEMDQFLQMLHKQLMNIQVLQISRTFL